MIRLFSRWFPVWVAAGLVVSVGTVRGQGTFIWSNARLPASARVVDCEGRPLGGTNHVVEIRVKDPATGKPVAGLEQVKDGNGAPLKTLTLLDGPAVGRFGSVTVRVPGIPGGQTVPVEVRVWDRRTGRDFESARVRGQAEVRVRLGGQGSPPAFPGLLTGLPAIRVCEAAK